MLTPQHEQQYREEGYCVFDGAIPGPLLLRLRHACEKARQLAREGSPNAQRLQPVGSYSDVGLDQQPFVEYGELAPLRAAVCGLLSQEHGFGDRGRFGVLLEPRDAAWSTFWHRDWRDNIEGIDTSLWWRHFHDRAYFNQINCALYDDECLWERSRQPPARRHACRGRALPDPAGASCGHRSTPFSSRGGRSAEQRRALPALPGIRSEHARGSAAEIESRRLLPV